jgi:hypothetical protein
MLVLGGISFLMADLVLQQVNFISCTDWRTAGVVIRRAMEW